MIYQKGHKGYWLGKKKPMKQETKDKIGKSLMGHKVSSKVKLAAHSPFQKGFTPWNKDKPWSESMKNRISDTNKRLKIEPKVKFVGFGENNPRWKGGVESENRRIRKSRDFRLWREAVYRRDNWTCQKTGVRGGTLHPHHILNFAEHPKLRFNVNNGVTLSEKSHNAFHRKYGKRNNTKKQILEFLCKK